MTRRQGFTYGLLFWSVPIAFWAIALGMVEPEDLIVISGEPIPPSIGWGVSVILLLFCIGMLFWGYKVRDQFHDMRERFVICILLVVWSGLGATGVLAIADRQAELIASGEKR